MGEKDIVIDCADKQEEKLRDYFRAQHASTTTAKSPPCSSCSPFIGPDLTIKLNNDATTVHGFLLSVKCEEFEKWLKKNNVKKLPDTVDLTTTIVTVEGLRKMVQFLYESGDILVNEENARTILLTAVYFRFTELRSLLEDYSLQLASKTKYVPKWLELACNYEVNAGYRNDLLIVAARDFQILAKVPELSQMSLEPLVQLLQRDDLKILSELEVFRVVLDWVKGHPGYTEQQLNRLLSTVRFVNMQSVTINECLQLAKDADLLPMVLPHAARSDWYKTCTDFQRLRESDVRENPRIFTFPQTRTENRCPLPIRGQSSRESEQNVSNKRQERENHEKVVETAVIRENLAERAAQEKSPLLKEKIFASNVAKELTKLIDEELSRPVEKEMSRPVEKEMSGPVEKEISRVVEMSQISKATKETKEKSVPLDTLVSVEIANSNFGKKSGDEKKSIIVTLSGKIVATEMDTTTAETVQIEPYKSAVEKCEVETGETTAKTARGEARKTAAETAKVDEPRKTTAEAEKAGIQMLDFGRPICLHFAQKRTEHLPHKERLDSYRRIDCRQDELPCKHQDDWVPKPHH